ncbi:MAG TPA: hypothetical protein VJK49_06415, partial [Candidatus Limnocylindrales bacterium]|nr:hypothetical protein [Candidatus Limnocylindrales bacterium]
MQADLVLPIPPQAPATEASGTPFARSATQRRGLLARVVGTVVPLAFVAAGTYAWAMGWQATYPLHLTSIEDTFWNHISPWTWYGVAAGTLALVSVVLLRSSPGVAAVATVAFVMSFSSSILLRYIGGADTPGVVALTSNLVATNQIDLAVHQYLQWPVTFLGLGGLALATGLTLASAAQGAFLVIAVSVSLALFVLFGRDHWAAAATGLFFVVSTPFLNWQLSPQLLAFLMLIGLLLLGRSRGIASVSVSSGLFVLLCFTHPFVSLWFIMLALCVRVVAPISRRLRLAQVQSWYLSPTLLAAVQIAVIVYVATAMLHDLATAVKRIGEALESGGSIAAAISISTVGSGDPDSPLYRGLVLVATAGVGAAGLLLAAGSLLRWRNRRTQPIEAGLAAVGLGHYVIGLVAPVLGGRGLQLVALALPPGLRDLAGRGKRSHLVGLAVSLVLLASPAIVATSMRYDTRYLTPGLQSAAELAVGELAADDPVLGAEVVVHYVQNLATVRLNGISPRFAHRSDLFDLR